MDREQELQIRAEVLRAKEDPYAILAHNALIKVLKEQDANSAERWGLISTLPIPAHNQVEVMYGIYAVGGTVLYCLPSPKYGFALAVYILPDNMLLLHLIPTIFEGENIGPHAQKIVGIPIEIADLTKAVDTIIAKYMEGIDVTL